MCVQHYHGEVALVGVMQEHTQHVARHGADDSTWLFVPACASCPRAAGRYYRQMSHHKHAAHHEATSFHLSSGSLSCSPSAFIVCLPFPFTPRAHPQNPSGQCRLRLSATTEFNDKIMSLIQGQIVSAVGKVSKENHLTLLGMIQDALHGRSGGGGNRRAGTKVRL